MQIIRIPVTIHLGQAAKVLKFDYNHSKTHRNLSDKHVCYLYVSDDDKRSTYELECDARIFILLFSMVNSCSVKDIWCYVETKDDELWLWNENWSDT